MAWARKIELIDVHCGGEIGRVVMPDAIDIPGTTLLDKMNYINAVDDRQRRFFVLEPRGAVHMSVNLLFTPTDPRADIAFFVLQADRAHPMSGSNLICVVTAALEHGIVRMDEPDTVVRVETPVGLIAVRAACKDGKCEAVTFDNVPTFVEQLGCRLQTRDFGTIETDIAFGGVYYGLVDAEQCGLRICQESVRALVDAGIALKAMFDEQVTVAHPEHRSIDHITYVMFRQQESPGVIRTCTILEPGRADRSPCGTGSSANLATLHARGQIAIGGTLTSRSITGAEFEVQLLEETMIAERIAVTPRVTGKAWVYGRTQLRSDPLDPFPSGFAPPDLW